MSAAMPHTLPFQRRRGVSLLDTVVGLGLMLVVFAGIAAAFQYTITVVSGNKSRAGAIALANDRLEYLRSLPYAQVGTSGGIPSGAIAQSETVSWNGTTYTRKTFVRYVDDAGDGLGAADSNGIKNDYKDVRVEVGWDTHSGARSFVLMGRISPMSVEGSVSGGVLTVSVVNSSSQPVPNAALTITNTSASPQVSITATTNDSGTLAFVGAPTAGTYQVTASKTGYTSGNGSVAGGATMNLTITLH